MIVTRRLQGAERESWQRAAMVDDLPQERRTVVELAAKFLERHWMFVCAALLVLAAFGAVVEGRMKPLWYDEVFTAIVASEPNWHMMQQAMPADGNPPLLALLSRQAMHLSGGHSDFAIRLPSLLGFLGAMLGVFVYVRRECGPVLGLFGMVLLLSQPGWTYSFEARPYALLLGFMMLGLVSWQSAARNADAVPRRSRWMALAGIVVAIVGGILSHHIGVVEVGVPLLAGEATRTWKRRRMDWPVAGTALAALPVLAWTLPMARRTNALLLQYQRSYVWPLTLDKFRHFWVGNMWLSFPLLVNCTLVLTIVIVLMSGWTPSFWNSDPPAADSSVGPRFGYGVLAAGGAAALLIPLTWLLMMSWSGYYNCRYGIGSIAGIAILASLLLHKTSRLRSEIAIGFMVMLLLLFVSPLLHDVRHLPGQGPPNARLYSDKSGLPLVVSDPFRYAPLWWYSPASTAGRLYYLTDKSYALESGFVIVEEALKAEAPVIPAHFSEFDRFLASHDRFVLDQSGTIPRVSMKDRLESKGFQVLPAESGSGSGIYNVQRLAGTRP